MNYSNEDLMRPGVYCIRNTVNGKVYIGSTKCFRDRWRKHRQELKHGRHKNPRLRAAWLKYGATAFVFEVVEIVDDLSLLLEKEQFWMDFYKSANGGVGYNASPTAGSTAGMSLSEQAKQKLRELNTGKKLTEECRAKISLGLRSSESAKAGAIRGAAKRTGQKRSPEAIEKHRQKFTGMKVPKISEAMKGRTKSESHRRNLSLAHTGKTLSEDHRQKISEGNRGKKRSAEAVLKTTIALKGVPRPYARDVHGKHWVVCSPVGETQEIFSLMDFCKKTGLTESAMRQVADGRARHHKEWRCCRTDDLECIARLGRPVRRMSGSREQFWRVTSPDGEVYEIYNLHGFCKERGLDSSSMIRVANGKCNHHKGWKCQRLPDDRHQ